MKKIENVMKNPFERLVWLMKDPDPTPEQLQEARQQSQLLDEERRVKRERKSWRNKLIRARYNLGDKPKSKEELLTERKQELLNENREHQIRINNLQKTISHKDNKINYLKKEIQKLKEPKEEFERIEKENQKQISLLKEEIKSKVREIEKESEEKESFKEQLKDLLLSRELLNRQDLRSKSLELLKELWNEKKKLIQIKIQPNLDQEDLNHEEENEDEGEEYPDQEIIYDPEQSEKCCYCGNPKSPSAKQCEECKRKINSIRVSNKCGMDEARTMYETKMEVCKKS